MTEPLHETSQPSPRRHRFLLFLAAGGVAAIVNIVSRILLNYVMPYEVAIVVAYLCGMTTAYVLNRLFVFDASGRSIHGEYLRFTFDWFRVARRDGGARNRRHRAGDHQLFRAQEILVLARGPVARTAQTRHRPK